MAWSLNQMDLLWKKEANGSYIDIFEDVNENTGFLMEYQLKIEMIAPDLNRKRNETSTALRQQGNTKLAEHKWHDAMTYYNKCLRYAEIGTENVSFAYANRSQCFLKLEMYDKCLVDIEMAIKANYPQPLMSKLEMSRDFCLKHLSGSEEVKNFHMILYHRKEVQSQYFGAFYLVT